MSLPVFVAESLTGDPIEVAGQEGKHAVTVSRLGIGDRVKLIDGRGEFVIGTVSSTAGKDRLFVDVASRGFAPLPRPRVTVVQAIPKSDRAELAVDLLTQGGADEIIAWQANRCIAKWAPGREEKQRSKWQQAAYAAAKQSRRETIPPVSGALTTAQVAELIRGKTAIVLHEEATRGIKDVDLDVEELVVIIGPEGGIGEEELALLGAESVRLGPEVFRTATAGLAALSVIGALSKRW